MFVMVLTAQQTVTLKFTSTTPSGAYYPFDVVNVTNVTRGWTESLMYPDTTMVLTSFDGLQEIMDNGGFLSEAYPNPFTGTANVSYVMQKSGEVTAKILGINGDILSEFNGFIEEGTHLITINISKPQMVILVVKTNDNQCFKKILNVGYGTSDNISISKISDNIGNAKTRSDGEFVIGDVMSYMAVSFYGGNMLESQRITQPQYTDETLSLLFNVNPNPEPPTVTTSVVTSITHNSAVAGGNVTSDGGAVVTERGVCWNTIPNPTASGSHVAASTAGTGSYTCQITGLEPATTYYLRAYAINSQGPSYGNEEIFSTMAYPSVTTNQVTDITSFSATFTGNVTNNGGGTVSARGFCWGTSQNPTINDSHIAVGSGTGSFSSTVMGLTANTVYYVRAYATNQAGTAYGEQRSFTTLNQLWANGVLPGLFSVSATQQVHFSQGNLQYLASMNIWKFAENQYDYVGEGNANVSPTYNGFIDLFGWGTSGYNHGAVCYQPWSTTKTYADYYAYGNPNYNLNDQTGKADWGFNAILNGGNAEHQWRTLSTEEWVYVFETRNTSSGIRYAMAQVNGVNGIMLLPDNWNSSTYNLNNTNVFNAVFTSNVINATTWTTLESAGAIFLPAAGWRSGHDVGGFNEMGDYWSSSNYQGSAASYVVRFFSGMLQPGYYSQRYNGYPVRLVKNYIGK